MFPIPSMSPFALGFRPFFLGAAMYAMVAMGTWTVAWQGQQVPGVTGLGAPQWWHAHGMVFGYSAGVIAGFLLTAIGNWTGRPTLHGWPLAALFSLWAAARAIPHFGATIQATAAVDLSFDLSLMMAATVPLFRARQWKNLAIFGPMLVLLTAVPLCTSEPWARDQASVSDSTSGCMSCWPSS